MSSSVNPLLELLLLTNALKTISPVTPSGGKLESGSSILSSTWQQNSIEEGWSKASNAELYLSVIFNDGRKRLKRISDSFDMGGGALVRVRREEFEVGIISGNMLVQKR